jgi:hypothetical protein
VVNDPTIDVRFTARDVRPRQPDARLDSEAFKIIEAAVTKHDNAPTLPTMITGATDMAYLRAKGMQCFGVGPVMDVEDGPKGFGTSSWISRARSSRRAHLRHDLELHEFVKITDCDLECRARSRQARDVTHELRKTPLMSLERIERTVLRRRGLNVMFDADLRLCTKLKSRC